MNQGNRQERMKYVSRHLKFGWWSLLLFLSLGIFLEALHGFKVSWYLNVGVETRRLMWRLAHAHGTLISLIHIAFAASVFMIGDSSDTRSSSQPDAETKVQPRRRGKKKEKHKATAPEGGWFPWASRALFGATVGIPGGFFLGGLFINGGDPGLGVLVLPIGAIMLLVSVVLIARGMTKAP